MDCRLVGTKPLSEQMLEHVDSNLKVKLNEILNEIHIFSLTKMHLKCRLENGSPYVSAIISSGCTATLGTHALGSVFLRNVHDQSGTKPNLVAKILATKFGFVTDWWYNLCSSTGISKPGFSLAVGTAYNQSNAMSEDPTELTQILLWIFLSVIQGPVC